MNVKTVISDANAKVEHNDIALSIKRGCIEALAGTIVFLALRYQLAVDEATAFAAATFVVTTIYKYVRQMGKKK